MAQISPKVFSKELQSILYPDNVFYTKGTKDTAAANATSVDIPQAGTIAVAADGSPVLPLTILERTDAVKNYVMEQLYVSPYMVTREEDIALSYDKTKSIVDAQGLAIQTLAASKCANAWGPATATISTTGAARTSTLISSTGTRRCIAKADILAVKKAFQKMNGFGMGIIGVITPDQHDDMLNIADFVDYEKTGNETKLKEGIIGRLMGIDFMVRWDDVIGSIGLHYSKNGNTKKDNGTVAADDRAAALFFNPKAVRYVFSYPETIINRKPAGYLGATIIESVVRFGATANRTDGKGVVSLVEAWVS